jgi:release factor glutamine methyltransferase
MTSSDPHSKSSEEISHTHPESFPTVRQLLAQATQTLSDNSPTARLDTEILLAHTLGWERARLFASSDHTPTPQQVAAFRQLVRRRANLEPVAYLVGQREFYGLTLQVDPRVLVPRPETELLVELARERARTHTDANPTQPPRLVDVGTGSGAIALALAHHLPTAVIYATDASRDALDVAAANLQRHHLRERVALLHGDLLSPLPEQVDIIVSNPPYTVLAEIDAGVRRHEPHLALDGGSDGLDIYRRLFAQAPRWLRPGGAMLVEIGATQAAAVTELAHAALASPEIVVQHDLAGLARVVVAQIAK